MTGNGRTGRGGWHLSLDGRGLEVDAGAHLRLSVSLAALRWIMCLGGATAAGCTYWTRLGR